MKKLKVIGNPYTPLDGPTWVKSYADTPSGRGTVVLTTDESEAMQFKSMSDAMEFWRQQSKSKPTRPDGKPNRPLTAYSVEIA